MIPELINVELLRVNYCEADNSIIRQRPNAKRQLHKRAKSIG